MTERSNDEPYGNYIPFDPDCPRVQELERLRDRAMDGDEAIRHRAICDRCMLLAVLSSEIVL